jgi:hypothetical protein
MVTEAAWELTRSLGILRSIARLVMGWTWTWCMVGVFALCSDTVYIAYSE